MVSTAFPVLGRLFRNPPTEPTKLADDAAGIPAGAIIAQAARYAGAIDAFTHGRSATARIVVIGEKSLDAYAVEVASLATGSTFCPINVDAPPARNAAIVQTFEPNLAFVSALHSELPIELADLLRNVPRLNPMHSGGFNFDRALREAHIAYVLFTSGTTGRPKGIEITYSSLEWFLSSILDRLRPPAEARWANHANLGFDPSILDLFGCLATNGVLVPFTTPLERSFSPGRIKAANVEVWQSVPSVIDIWQRTRAGESGYLQSLKCVMLGGEPCRRSWVEYLLKYCGPGVKVFNCYGPTEATVYSTIEEMAAGYSFDDDEPNVAIGSPIEGAVVELRPSGGDFPELVIAGPGVGQGYLRAAAGELSGYSLEGQTRIYRTGDCGERVGARLYFRGRLDSQVKLRGYRFELGELEELLGRLGLAHGYATTVGADVVLVVDGKTAGSDTEILEALRQYVPGYAVPRRILRSPDVPRGSNDKVDRAALAAWARKALNA